MKWSIVVAASKDYKPGLTAFLNSFERYHCCEPEKWGTGETGNGIIVYLLTYNFEAEWLDAQKAKRPYLKVVQLDLDAFPQKAWVCKLERFKFASELDGVVMMADADMFFCDSMLPYFDLAEKGWIVGGANGSNFRFHQAWRDKYKIPEIPDLFDHKTICSVPTLMDVSLHGEVWRSIYEHKRTIGVGADFDLTNIFMAVHQKLDVLIPLPSQQTTGIHHFMLKPDTRVRRIDGKLVTTDGLPVLMVHGKWWNPGWCDNLMTVMERYCKGNNACLKGAKESRQILKKEFEKNLRE